MLTETSATPKPKLNGRSECPCKQAYGDDDEHAWIENVAVSVFAMDLSQYVKAWNRRTVEITGISAQEILDRPLSVLIDKDSHSTLEGAMEEMLHCRDLSSSCELSFCRESGSSRGLQIKMSALQNSTGQTIGVLCFAENIRQSIHPSSKVSKLEVSQPADSISKFFESFDFPVFGMSSDGLIDFWNVSMEALTDYPEDYAKNRNFADFIVGDSNHSRWQRLIDDSEQGNGSAACQLEILTKHGQSIHIILNLSTRRDVSDNASGLIAVVTETPENLRNRSVVVPPADPRESTVSPSDVAVPVIGVDREGIIVLWNLEIADLTGMGSSEAIGSKFVEDFVCPEFQSSTLEAVERCSHGGKPFLDTKIRVKSGRTIHLSGKVSVRKDVKGEFVGLNLFLHDVTEATASGKLAKELSHLIRTANAPIFGVDRHGNLNLWNDKAVEILGFSREFVIGKPLVETFIDPSLRQSLEVALSTALKGSGTSNYELEFVASSGETRYLLVNLTTRRNAGDDIVGVVGVGQDVTEAAQHDRAVAAMARELRQLVDTANTPIFGVDTAGCVNEWNDKTAEITGFSGDEAFNEPLVDTFIAPDLRPAVQEVLDNALRGRGTSNFELEIRTKANELRYLLVNATTRRDEENNVVGVVAVAQDVTEACKHDRAVAAMANELRQLIDTANAPIFGIDRDGDVNEWNDKTAEITGYTKEEAFDCSLVETFIVPSMRDSVQDVLDNALEGRGTSNYELEFRTKSNEIRHLLVNATTRRDAENNVVGVVGVAQDVTEAVQRDRAVAGMALELRQLIDTANAPIFGIDIDGNVNEWNRRTSEITGYSKEEAFDEPLVETFIAPSMQDKVQEILDSALEGNETSNYELEFVSRDGEPRFLLVNATTRRDPENVVVGVVGVAQDVTEDRKHAQALREMQYLRASQEAKVETERNMTAYFAHELRNPLGAIDSALNAMPDELPDAAKSLISGMQLCTGFMSSIMNNLLDVRKMEEGKMKLSKSPISLKNLLHGVHKMLLPSVRPGVKFETLCKTKGCDWVLGDAHRIQQVMTNVVTNAIKYTVTGSVTMLIAWEGSKVKFECVDTGPGIPKNEQEKLFQRFVQRGGAPGTGLGLAIAKHLVDLTGGSIRFDSDPTVKAGTTCVVLMPLALCNAPETVVVESTALIQEPITFLIIDDIKMNRMMLKRRIMKGIAPNSAITEAATGEEALEICGNKKFDVIVADQYMEEAGGVMVGTDVVFAMRRMRIDSVIIGCSGNDMGTQFFEAGADWVWQKPMPSNAKIIQDLRASLNKRAHKKQQE